MKDKSIKGFLFLVIITAGVLVTGWSLIAAASSTTLTIGMVAPVLVALAFILWAIYRLKYKKPLIQHKGWRIAVTVFVCVGFAVMVALETVILTAMLAPPPDEDADCLIVLGCGIFPDGRLTLSLKNRLDTAYDYLAVHKGTLCIVSGGKGDNEPVPEAQVMKDYLVSRGVDEARVIEERRSTSTEENLIYSMALMRARDGGDGPVGIVSNDYHLYRALTRTKRYGLKAFGLGAPTPWRVLLTSHVRECFAVLEMLVFG